MNLLIFDFYRHHPLNSFQYLEIIVQYVGLYSILFDVIKERYLLTKLIYTSKLVLNRIQLFDKANTIDFSQYLPR